MQPEYVKINQSGSMMIWDQGLRQFREVRIPDSSTEQKKLSQTRNSMNYDDVWKRMVYTETLSNWGIKNYPKGFWDESNEFWAYVTDDGEDTNTTVFPVTDSSRSMVNIPFRIKKVIPKGEHWIIQTQDPSAPLYRWDPGISNGLVDTTSQRIKGSLKGLVTDKIFLTRHDNEILLYDGDSRLRSRKLRNISDLSIHNGNIYSLTNDGRLLQLDQDLSIRFTYTIPGNLNFNQVGVYDDIVYLTGESGFYSARLEKSQRSFFNQTFHLDLQKEARIVKDRLQSEYGQQLWIETKNSSHPEIHFNTPEQKVNKLSFNGEYLHLETLEGSLDQLSRNAFQFFQLSSTYWNGRDRLYYYFANEQRVESYDENGRLVREVHITFDDFQNVKDLVLLSADSETIYMKADVVDPERGFRSSILTYDWQGNLDRKSRLHHPLQGHRFPMDTHPQTIDMGQNESIYELHNNHIQKYDEKGYPTNTIQNVYYPTDVYSTEEYLYVLDLNGWRMRIFEKRSRPAYRFSSPYESLEVTDIHSSSSNKAVFSGYSVDDGNNNSNLYEYDMNSREYQLVLDHPQKSLSYPTLTPSGDTLYFWGKSRSRDKFHTLFRSDLMKYSARSLSNELRVRGNGFYSSDHKKLFVPVSPTKNDTNQYYVVDPDYEQNPLANSSNLHELEPGGFAGFYGVEKRGDTSYILSGYLNRKDETAPLRWNTSDTIYRTSEIIDHIYKNNGDLYFTVSGNNLFTRLGVIRNSRQVEINSTNDFQSSLRWIYSTLGSIKIAQVRDSHIRFLHQYDSDKGHLVDLFRNRPPPSGGIQGNLKSGSPKGLRGLKLRVEPGGQQVVTQQGGRFSVGDVPVGYVQLQEDEYDFNFTYDLQVPINSDEFTINNNIPVKRDQERSLFEKGIRFFGKEKYKRSRISLEAFRELVQERPYIRWANTFLEVIYRKSGKMNKLAALYKTYPRLFSPEERLELYLQTQQLDSLNRLKGNVSSLPFRNSKDVFNYLNQKNEKSESIRHYPSYKQYSDHLPYILSSGEY